MPFLCKCPACGHIEKRPLANYPEGCPRCHGGWLGNVRTDPPIALDHSVVNSVVGLSTAMLEMIGQMTPEQAFTAAGQLEERIFEEQSPASQRFMGALIGRLEERAAGKFPAIIDDDN